MENKGCGLCQGAIVDYANFHSTNGRYRKMKITPCVAMGRTTGRNRCINGSILVLSFSYKICILSCKIY